MVLHVHEWFFCVRTAEIAQISGIRSRWLSDFAQATVLGYHEASARAENVKENLGTLCNSAYFEVMPRFTPPTRQWK
jgi:hypothetical protein